MSRLGEVYGSGSWQWESKQGVLQAETAIAALRALRRLARSSATHMHRDALLPSRLEGDLLAEMRAVHDALSSGSLDAQTAPPNTKQQKLEVLSSLALDDLPGELRLRCLRFCDAATLARLEGSSTALRVLVEGEVVARLRHELGGAELPQRRTKQATIELEKGWGCMARFLEARGRAEAAGAHRLAAGRCGLQHGADTHWLLAVTDDGRVSVHEHSSQGSDDPLTARLARTVQPLVGVTAVAASEDHGAVIAHGRLLTFGRGENGKLGLGHSNSMVVLEPQIVSGFDEDAIVAVTLTAKNTAFVTATGRAYFCGTALRSPKVGVADADEVQSPIRLLPGDDRHFVACSAVHRPRSVGVQRDGEFYMYHGTSICLLTDQGEITMEGSLADSCYDEHHLNATKGLRIASMSLARGRALFVTSLGRLIQVGGTFSERSPRQTECRPCPYAGHELIPGKRIVAAAAASRHGIACADDGRVYTWGVSRHGQLGNGSCSHTHVMPPAEVQRLVGTQIVAVSASTISSAVMCKDSCVYSWGRLGTNQIAYDVPRIHCHGDDDGGAAQEAAANVFRFNFT